MPRRCFRDPIQEVFRAAELLDRAASAHLSGSSAEAARLIREADDPLIWAWTDSIWGKRNPEVHFFHEQPSPLPHLARSDRPSPRMPDRSTRLSIIARDGFHCRFCGIPVIPVEVRQLLNRAYPEAAKWGRRNVDQHAALQCMWLQFDHLIPNERGGRSDIENVVITCAPCNFGRMQLTIEEAGLENPLVRPVTPTWRGFDRWDGLTRILNRSNADAARL
jgi:5-methylcytosine-specific restriction endonuclease McrA